MTTSTTSTLAPCRCDYDLAQGCERNLTGAGHCENEPLTIPLAPLTNGQTYHVAIQSLKDLAPKLRKYNGQRRIVRPLMRAAESLATEARNAAEAERIACNEGNICDGTPSPWGIASAKALWLAGSAATYDDATTDGQRVAAVGSVILRVRHAVLAAALLPN